MFSISAPVTRSFDATATEETSAGEARYGLSPHDLEDLGEEWIVTRMTRDCGGKLHDSSPVLTPAGGGCGGANPR
jgi:hypothetical protein